jgi:hypothetical protein
MTTNPMTGNSMGSPTYGGGACRSDRMDDVFNLAGVSP